MRALLLLCAIGCAETQPVEVPIVTANEAANPPPADPEYVGVVERVAAMVRDGDLAGRAERRGLSLVNVTWEDTARLQGSSIGPNISDFTLQVRHSVAQTTLMPWFSDIGAGPLTRWETTHMPVIRRPSFSDVTADVPVDRFFVRVGNARGGPLASVALMDLVRDLGRFATDPATLTDHRQRVDLSAPRDTHFLVSAQALFLPIPRQGGAEFNPVLFNYQSAPGSPAVLAILATREGTSMTVIENRTEDQGVHWGQELYFDHAGQRAYFTAERRSDVSARIAAQGGPRNESDRSALAAGADVMALIQVPLVHDNRGVFTGATQPDPGYGYQFSDDPLSLGGFGPNDATIRVRPGPVRTDLERAVLGHGALLGPFHEGHGTKLVRDARFPIRITLQFYKATATGEVSDADLDGITTTIANVYAHADYVGSLVLPADDARRPTAWQHVPDEWFPW